MRQDGHENAALRVVEDPLYDQPQADDSKGEDNEVKYSTSRWYIRKILGWGQDSETEFSLDGGFSETQARKEPGRCTPANYLARKER